jgi:hypothetical protein
VAVAHDEAGVLLLDRPRRREAAGGQRVSSIHLLAFVKLNNF